MIINFGNSSHGRSQAQGVGTPDFFSGHPIVRIARSSRFTNHKYIALTY